MNPKRTPERPLPDPGEWAIDTTHSFVAFHVAHYGIAIARGIASGPTGTIEIREPFTTSSVRATIDPRTITTANGARDDKLRGTELLEVDRFPSIEFVSTRLETGQPEGYRLEGNLTLHGVTQSVALDLSYNGILVDPKGKPRFGLTARTNLRRDQFAAGEWGHVALTGGGYMVPHEVRIVLDIEAIPAFQ